MAAYATNAGIKSTVFCPDDTPEINIREIQSLGAETYLVNGLINDCGKIVGEGKEKVGWFDVSTLKEPYRIEGKKTMGLELAEQLNWELPDVIFLSHRRRYWFNWDVESIFRIRRTRMDKWKIT